MRTFPADSSIDVTTLEEIFLDVTERQKRGKIKKTFKNVEEKTFIISSISVK